MPNPNKKPLSGWFVEIDSELKAEFKAYFPGRAAMKKLTVTAIKTAIAYAKQNNLPKREEK